MAKKILGFVASSADSGCAVDIRKHLPPWRKIRNTSTVAFLPGRKCWPEIHLTKSILQLRIQRQRVFGTHTHSRSRIATLQVSVLLPVSLAHSNSSRLEMAA